MTVVALADIHPAFASLDGYQVTAVGVGRVGGRDKWARQNDRVDVAVGFHLPGGDYRSLPLPVGELPWFAENGPVVDGLRGTDEEVDETFIAAVIPYRGRVYMILVIDRQPIMRRQLEADLRHPEAGKALLRWMQPQERQRYHRIASSDSASVALSGAWPILERRTEPFWFICVRTPAAGDQWKPIYGNPQVLATLGQAGTAGLTEATRDVAGRSNPDYPGASPKGHFDDETGLIVAPSKTVVDDGSDWAPPAAPYTGPWITCDRCGRHQARPTELACRRCLRSEQAKDRQAIEQLDVSTTGRGAAGNTPGPHRKTAQDPSSTASFLQNRTVSEFTKAVTTGGFVDDIAGADAVARVLAKLDPVERAVIEARADAVRLERKWKDGRCIVNEMPIEESLAKIAARLGIPEKEARNALQRVRRAIDPAWLKDSSP